MIRRGTMLAGVAVFLLLRGLAAAGYTDNGDGTVSDTTTGLMWQQQDDAVARTWETALTYCEGLSLGPYDDWRLPNIKELKSLVDTTLFDPAIDPLFTNTISSHYWSSTTSVSNSPYAWYVYFKYGVVNDYYKTNAYYVRCVR